MKKVLVLDDNIGHLQLMTHILKKEGMSVNTFQAGADALLWLKENEVDLILLDIQMPGMNGLEILSEIRKNEKLKNIKCVAFTAQDKFQNKSFKDLGFDDVLLKPINPRTFTSFIKRFFV